MRFISLTLLTVVAASSATAQITETPVTFDSAGRVPAITQALAERLHLAPPAWPVLGSFVNARLYSRSDSGFTLVVARSNGSFDRYALNAAEAESLRGLIRTAIASGRRAGLGEQTIAFSDPAGNAFVRNQALLGILIYGPAAATLVGSSSRDGSAAAATELLVSGGTFFAALARRSASPPVTTAQNILATHAATRGAALGLALATAGNASQAETVAGSILLGSVGGTIVGLAAGKRMSDGEAASAGLGADLAALTSLGVMGASGVFYHNNGATTRGAMLGASAALVGGYFVGPQYAWRARYTVTAGDVRALSTTALLGAAVAATPFIDDKPHDERVIYGALTAGLLGGAVFGDRVLVRPRDHTRSEGTLLWTGASAGALVGAGVAAAGDAGARTTWMIGTTGALLGVLATEAVLRPAPGGHGIFSGEDARTGRVSSVTGARTSRVDVKIDPIGAAFAARARHGTFSVMRVSF
ncbi:MAG TPA: hypothetical protein VHM30_00035 [Gemmatimonadaceae bacterium]|nr:hypothetical protein [Gemmatimonadaceae bacterium]